MRRGGGSPIRTALIVAVVAAIAAGGIAAKRRCIELGGGARCRSRGVVPGERRKTGADASRDPPGWEIDRRPLLLKTLVHT
jgi:hypothetical protein